MVQNRFNLIIIIAALTILCVLSCNDGVRTTNILSKEQNKDFENAFIVNDLLSHFYENNIGQLKYLLVDPPGCPPRYKCLAQSGEIYIVKTFESINYFRPNKFLYTTQYVNDSNIIINSTRLKNDVFPIEKCHKFFNKKYPIPYFESYNFKLGGEYIEKVVDGKTVGEYTYSIPSDLEVYVIEAEPGNFWKEKCPEPRPESLKEWKNGYSKGIAISKKEKLIVYWVIIW